MRECKGCSLGTFGDPQLVRVAGTKLHAKRSSNGNTLLNRLFLIKACGEYELLVGLQRFINGRASQKVYIRTCRRSMCGCEHVLFDLAGATKQQSSRRGEPN